MFIYLCMGRVFLGASMLEHGVYLSRCIDVYLCMGRIFLGASMLEHGAYLSRCVDVRLCMGRVFLGASMSSLWDWPSFYCDFWISI